ncbi:helix-turn-helix domain-containing protein [Streptosporangium sp. NPDC050855]|uniref:helix-turn-helix domain-containing protein n=1 Tax=Streptosporangium sp. NPDC050855 TaxID=3366194 RepID=UPI0037AAE4DD
MEQDLTVADLTLISVDDLCKMWRVNADWIYDMVALGEDKGGLPHHRLGRRTLRFKMSELATWLDARRSAKAA